MKSQLTRAQQRVLDFLMADESGDFIIVPRAVVNVTSPLDKLISLGLIEQELRSVPLPPGSHEMFYRAIRS